MTYNLYSVRDNQTIFGQPFIEQNEAAAIRGFSYAINEGNELMKFRPADYDLYFIGKFDAEDGVIESLPSPRLVVSGTSVLNVV